MKIFNLLGWCKKSTKMSQYDNEESKNYWVLKRWDKVPSIPIGTKACTCKIYVHLTWIKLYVGLVFISMLCEGQFHVFLEKILVHNCELCLKKPTY